MIRSRSGERSRRWAYPAVIVVAVLASVLLRLPALDVGLHGDDYMQHGMLEGIYPGAEYSPFDAYAFVPDDDGAREALFAYGVVPWWMARDTHAALWRPVSSALLAIDRLAVPASSPDAARSWHIHSFFWLGAAILAAGLALRRFLPPSMWALSLMLLASDVCFTIPVIWIANRCALVSATFAWLAVWAHLRWRVGADASGRSRAVGVAMEIVFVALSLGAGEYGIGGVTCIVAYELLDPHRLAAGSLRRRLPCLAPAMITSAVYLGIHEALGFGTSGISGYVGAFETPRLWLDVATRRLPRLISSGFWGVPADPSVFRGRLERIGLDGLAPYSASHNLELSLALVAVATLVTTLTLRALSATERRAVGALSLGALVALVPVCSAPLNARLLIVAAPGFAALTAAVWVSAARAARSAWLGQGSDRPWRARMATLPAAAIGILLLLCHVPNEVDWGWRQIGAWRDDHDGVVQFIEGGDLLDTSLAGKEVVILRVPDHTVGLFGNFIADARGHARADTWRTLSMLRYPATLERTDDNTLEMTSHSEHWLSGVGGFYRRGDRPLPRGTVLELPGLQVEILDDFRGYPIRVRFTFPRSLDDPSYVFAEARDRTLYRRGPIPVGVAVPVPAQ